MKTKKLNLTAIVYCLLFLISNYSNAQLEYKLRGQNKDCSSLITQSDENIKGSIDPDYIIDSAYQLMQVGHIPGASLCVIHGSETMWIHHLGWANIEDNIPVSDSTMFQLASISKTVAATALMHLWESDTFNLDDDINEYLPFEVKNPNCPDEPITFFQLLTHTSSIKDNWNGVMQGLVVFGSESPIQLDTFLYHYLVPGGEYYYAAANYTGNSPGSEWVYCNVNFALIGYLVECISGHSFEAYCQQHIFQPLEMNNTSWFLSGLDTTNVAMQYEWDWLNSQYVPYGFSDYPYYPCGQLRCTALDLAKFLSMTMNYGTLNGMTILDSLTVELMTTMYVPILVYDELQGLGWYYSNKYDIWMHTGGWYGVLTMAGYDKQYQWGTMELSNGDFYSSGVQYSIALDALMVDFSRQHHPLSVDSIFLSDADGDFILEHDEEIKLLLGLRNNMNISDLAENVTLHLSSTDPSIAGISTSDISFGDIFYKEMVFNSTDSLTFKMSDNLTSPKVNFTVTINWGEGKEYSSDFEFQVGSADILLVRDETDWRGNLVKTQDWYLQVLDSLGYSTYYYDLSVLGDPKIEFLSHFPAVIWYTGYDLDNMLTGYNQQVLAEYLDNGGKLFLNGQNISDELAGTDFLQNYLHTEHIEDTWDGLDIIEGIEGDPIGHDLVFWINTGDVVTGHNSTSVVEPTSDGHKVFNYYSTQDGAAIRYDSEIYKTVFFAFGFETINEFENRYEVLSRILEYFDLSTGQGETYEPAVTSLNIQVYPNPFVSTANISYVLPRESVVSLKIYDIHGHMIAELINESQYQGEQNVQVDLAGKPPGIYFAVIYADGEPVGQAKFVMR